MFENLAEPLIDELYRTAAAFRSDARENKLDLGVGVYRDENGLSPVMRCVREAEKRLCETNDTKAYLPLAGAPLFISSMSELVFQGNQPDRIAAVQTVGGTGGIRLALELAQQANPDLTVHLGVPSWPNHKGICDRLKIPMKTYDYLDDSRSSATVETALLAIDGARAGDVLILHGPCHNPTGLDLDKADGIRLIEHAASKGLVPLIDAAYYGLGNELASDLADLREMLERVPEGFLSISGSKAFGLYRDRIGILFAKGKDEADAAKAQSNAQVLARVNYSAPAAHGAQVIATILSDRSLKQDWFAELDAMRQRMSDLREQIRVAADDHPALRTIWHTKGIFSLLPIGAEETQKLARDYAIYMPPSGRVNLAGLSVATVPRFVDAVVTLVPRTQ